MSILTISAFPVFFFYIIIRETEKQSTRIYTVWRIKILCLGAAQQFDAYKTWKTWRVFWESFQINHNHRHHNLIPIIFFESYSVMGTSQIFQRLKPPLAVISHQMLGEVLHFPFPPSFVFVAAKDVLYYMETSHNLLVRHHKGMFFSCLT